MEAAGGVRKTMVAFALKANHNINLLKHLSSLGSGASVASENELRVALNVGFPPSKIVLNGNGKQQKAIEIAVNKGILMNVDSEFDLQRIASVAAANSKKAKVLLRINPDVEISSGSEGEFEITP